MSFSEILNKIYNFWNIVVFENTLWRVFFAVVVFVVLFFLAKYFLNKVKNNIDKIGSKFDKIWSFFYAFLRLPFWFWVFVDLFLVSKILILPPKVIFVINAVFLLVVIFWVAKIVVKVSGYFFWKVLKWNPDWKRAAELIVNILVWALWILLFLTNIWVNLTPLVASLWVASIAIAFSLQNILSDLFASFSILFSKIFVIGDFVEIGSFSGTVKSITLKSTILGNVSGQDVVIPNNSVLTSTVVNYGKSKYRWQRVILGVTYSTGVKQLKEIPQIVEKVISWIADTEFEWCYFKKMSDYSLDFLVSYKCLSPDFQKMLEINEKINLWIFEEFEKRWIEFAFPSQTLYTYNLDNSKNEKSPT